MECNVSVNNDLLTFCIKDQYHDLFLYLFTAEQKLIRGQQLCPSNRNLKLMGFSYAINL